jgi:adenine-specific DNA-methyltransferase
LKVLCDEIFKRDNFIRNIVWQKRTSPDMRATIGDGHDHILVYAKYIEIFKDAANNLNKTEEQRAKFKNPDKDPKGPWVSSDFTAQGFRPNQMYKIITPGGVEYSPPTGRCWKNIESVYLDLVDQGRMWFGSDDRGVPRRKTYLKDIEKNAVWSWWTNKEVGHNQEAKKEAIALFGPDDPFSTPKPERLLERIISIATDEGDLILDFFAGSGTAAAVALKMKRQFIAIEQMDYIEKYTINRLKKVVGRKYKPDGEMVEILDFDQGGVSTTVNWKGGGSFIHLELMGWNEVLGRKIISAKTSEELLEYWVSIKDKGFINFLFNNKKFEESEKEFTALNLEEQKKFLLEMLDKNQLYVNISEIDDTSYQVSETDKKLNIEFYNLDSYA